MKQRGREFLGQSDRRGTYRRAHKIHYVNSVVEWELESRTGLSDIQRSVRLCPGTRTLFGVAALRLLAALVVVSGAAAVSCGGDSGEKILPGPVLMTSGGSASGGSTAGSGAGHAAGGDPAACPVQTPDRCPGPGGAPEVCVALDSDPTSCGRCGVACEPQAACAAGVCAEPPVELMAAKGCGDVRLALDGSSLFWTEQASGRVRSIALEGGPITEVASEQLAPRQLAVDAGGVYWVNQGDGTTGSSSVMKAPLPLAAPPFALVSAPATDPITGVALESDKLYYGLGHDVHAISTDENADGDVIVGVAFARNDTREPDGVPDALSVHDGRVYWIVTDVGSVESDDILPGSDGLPRIAHGAQMWPNDLGFAGAYVYYTAFESLFAAKADSPAVAVASSNDYSPLSAFAVNAENGYFADQGGHISRHGVGLPLAPTFEPTPSAQLVRGQGNVTAVVLDAKHVYWASVDAASGACAIRTLSL